MNYLLVDSKEERVTMKIPRGFKFGGLACGIKASGKKDLALICTCLLYTSDAAENREV